LNRAIKKSLFDNDRNSYKQKLRKDTKQNRKGRENKAKRRGMVECKEGI